MDVPLELAFHNLDTSPALEQLVRERAERMQRRFARVNSCRVVVEPAAKMPSGKILYRCRIETRVPDRELVVSNAPGDQRDHFTAAAAVRDAFDAMERQLEQHSQKVRGDTKTHAAPLQGKVLRLFPEYGFIATNDGREIYFHRNAVLEGRFEDLEVGTPVDLSIVHDESPMGPQATTVRPLGPMRFVPEPPDED
jgi:cold shock CspA family protein/ribosome-associated translation inhibitor RaiA